MDTLLSDIRYGFRALVRSPAVTIVIVIALGLGIGANTAIFSAMNAVLFRPLPYFESNRLVMVWGRFTDIGIPNDRNFISPPELTDLRRYAQSFSGLAAMSATSFSLSFGDRPERVVGSLVSPEFFQLLGVEPRPGRAFLPENGALGQEMVVVLGHDLWQRRFGADTSAVGRTIGVDGRSFTVVGVAPPGFRFPRDAEMWAPLAFTDAQLSPRFRGNHGLEVMARIKSDVSLEQARADMAAVTRQIMEGAADYPYARFNFLVLISPFLEEVVGDIRPALLLLMGAVALVLLIACANVANLLLAKASAREHEIGLRLALGATRRRLIRQLLTESVMLALAGAVAGMLLARLGLTVLASLGATVFPRVGEARLDLITLAFTTGVAILAGLLFGVVPAFHSTGTGASGSLKEGRRSTAGAERQRLRRLLIVTEVALALVLLTGSGLLIRSFARLMSVDPGFKPDGVLTMRISLPQARYSSPERIRAFYLELERRLRELPGVQAVGAISGLPLTGQGGSGTTTVDTQAVPFDRSFPEADSRAVTPGYLQAMGVQLLKGRDFDDRDNETSTPVAIIDETMANTYWPDGDAIGRRIKRGGPPSPAPWMTVVGVVRHVRYASLERPSRVQYVYPLAQLPVPSMSVAIRAGSDQNGLPSAVQRLVTALDADLPVYAIRTMNDVMSVSVMRRRLVMLLLTVLAGLAMVLAAVGIYGVISYWVAERTQEIGIRVALGASEVRILRMALEQGLAVVFVGVIIGGVGSLILTRTLEGMLFNVSATDPTTFVSVALGLMGVAVLASYLPARRAARLDPAHSLRES